MGIRRDGRKPKRRRTILQRLRGRMKVEFALPDPAPAASPSSAGAAPKGAGSQKKPAAARVAVRKPAAEGRDPKKAATSRQKAAKKEE
ncbi:MAG: hypothetical protein IH851_04105 [Armatimonadetes bacterium]|nr:hypothetical protein [Armatimonadota bacterium]